MYRTTLLLASLSLLSACGGSSSSSEASSVTPSENTPVTALNTLSVMAKYKDACGNETPAHDAALLIHNNDYSNKEIIYADVNGKLTYQAEDSSQNISIVMRGNDEVDGVKPVILTTYMDYPMKDMGNYYHNTNATDTCDCMDWSLKINTPARVNDIGEGRISGVEDTGLISNNRGSTEFNDIKYCMPDIGAMPIVSATVSFTNPEESFGALIPDILSKNEFDAELEGTVVEIITNDEFASKQVTTVIDGERLFRNYAFNQSDNVYAFSSDSLDYYTVTSYKFDFIDDFSSNDAFLLTTSVEYSNDLNKTFDLPLPEVDYTNMYDVLINDSAGQYDFSQIENMDSFSIVISALKDDQLMLDWTFIAPTSGQVPTIENIDLTTFISDSVLDASVNTIELTTFLVGYNGISGYQEYINNISERTVENSAQTKWSRRESAIFEITITDVDFSSSTSPLNISKAINNHLSNRTINTVPIKSLSKDLDKISNTIPAALLTR